MLTYRKALSFQRRLWFGKLTILSNVEGESRSIFQQQNWMLACASMTEDTPRFRNN